jgi:transposase
MSRRELRRVGVFTRVESGDLKLKNAAEILGLSYRQSKRLWKRYRAEGSEGLKHRSAGRESNRRKPKKLRDRVLQLVRRKYWGEQGERFGPTLAAEHLASDDHLEVNAQTLRRWMLEEGLWNRARKRRVHRSLRERKAHFGELVQLDGSFHDWLEGRGPRGCLMDLVDDATSQAVASLGKEETTWAAAGVLHAWIEKYGVPVALYTDWKNVYVREPTEKELLHGKVSVTQFGAMCARLGIKIIAASSPQAKGRVERNHGTHQDRLVKKMRLKKIATYEAANEFLRREYIPEHNRRFARRPASPEDYHYPAPGKRELAEAFHIETEHVIGNNWVVRHDNRYFQVQRQGQYYPPAKSQVQVCEWEDGRLEIRYRGRKVQCQEIPAPGPVVRLPTAQPSGVRRKPPIPTADHPWRQDYRKMRPWHQPKPAANAALAVAGFSASP